MDLCSNNWLCKSMKWLLSVNSLTRLLGLKHRVLHNIMLVYVCTLEYVTFSIQVEPCSSPSPHTKNSSAQTARISFFSPGWKKYRLIKKEGHKLIEAKTEYSK